MTWGWLFVGVSVLLGCPAAAFAQAPSAPPPPPGIVVLDRQGPSAAPAQSPLQPLLDFQDSDIKFSLRSLMDILRDHQHEGWVLAAYPDPNTHRPLIGAGFSLDVQATVHPKPIPSILIRSLNLPRLSFGRRPGCLRIVCSKSSTSSTTMQAYGRRNNIAERSSGTNLRHS